MLRVFAVAGNDILVERNIVGHNEILTLVFLSVVYHIGKVGKMLGCGNLIRVALRSRSAAVRHFRIILRITPRVSRMAYTPLPSEE